ncbi:multimerin-1 [Discoglossus pictus]
MYKKKMLLLFILRMKIILLVIVLNIDGCNTRGDSLDITDKPITTPEDAKTDQLHSKTTLEPTSVSSQASHITTISEDSPASTTLKYSTIASPEEQSKGLKTFEKIFVSPTQALSTVGAVQLEENAMTSVQNGNIPVKSDMVITQQAATVNRSPRQNSPSRASLSSNKNPSFETTRGKNWCAYVHTRLMPTVAMDNVETYISSGASPCSWNTGPCSVRYRMISQPVYRMKHKIVTSLEWKCCPGYSGEQCKSTAPKVQSQIPESQAESNMAANTVDTRDNRGIKYDIALQQKMSDHIDSQEMKLALLQKKVDNISSSMGGVHKTLYSLEEKINSDYRGKDVQTFLKDLKSKSITELIKDIVNEQLSAFRMDMQETIAQLFKTMSGMSIELEQTKEEMKQINNTMVSSNQKCHLEQDNTPTMDDILELKNRVEKLKNTAFVCTSSFKEMEEKHNNLKKEMEHERSRSNIYFESLNGTLSKMKEIHEQLLSDEHGNDLLVSPIKTPMNNNVTEYFISMQDRIKKQNIMMLQLYDDINAQDNKINNLTVTLELQRQSIERACEDRFSSCKKDFQKQLKGTEETVHVLNKTVSDVVLPLDDKIDKMNEQINDLCYDMEILQPFIEKGAPFSMTSEYEHENDIVEVNRQIQNLTSVLHNLSSRIEKLTKGQEELWSDAQRQDQVFDRRINECLMEVEDGLNNTMDILNDAVDYVRDNYMLKSDMSPVENGSQNDNATEKLESLMSVVPLFSQMNETLQSLVAGNRKRQAYDSILDISEISNDDNNIGMSSFANLSQQVNKIATKLNETNLNISQINEQLQTSNLEVKSCQTRLQSIESQMTLILANPTTSPKTRKEAVVVKEKGQQELNSRIKVLEFKTVRLSTSLPQVNKTAYEAKGLCQTVFITIKEVNNSIPRLLKSAQPNTTSLQKGFEELLKSLIEVKMGTILSNVTSYVDKAMFDVTSSVEKLQKQMKIVLKKPVAPKKPAANATASLAGRSQRNTDIADQDEISSCSSSPCYNGGTCINDRKTFVCACRHPFGGVNCSLKMSDENTQSFDFTKGSYRYAPLVAFYASQTYGMTTPGPIRFNNLYVNYGSSYTPRTGKFHVPYLGVYIFKFTIESYSPRVSGYLVVDDVDKIAFQSENINSNMYSDRVITGDALLELNYGQAVWLRLATGSIPAQYPPVTTFTGYLLNRT